MNIDENVLVKELIDKGMSEDAAVETAKLYMEAKSEETVKKATLPFPTLSFNSKEPQLNGFNKFVSKPVYSEDGKEKIRYDEVLGDEIECIIVHSNTQCGMFKQFKTTIEPKYTKKINHIELESGLKLDEYCKKNNISLDNVDYTNIYLMLVKVDGEYKPYIHYATSSRSMEISNSLKDYEYGIVELKIGLTTKPSKFGTYMTFEVRGKRNLTKAEIETIRIDCIKSIAEFKKYVNEFNNQVKSDLSEQQNIFDV